MGRNSPDHNDPVTVTTSPRREMADGIAISDMPPQQVSRDLATSVVGPSYQLVRCSDTSAVEGKPEVPGEWGGPAHVQRDGIL